MSASFEFDCSAHPILEGVNRKQKVYFSVPDNINERTGMLLLIAGFGGAPSSNVYKKMRSNFSDTYNLVVVQTEYMGTEFMGEFTEFLFMQDFFQGFYDSFPPARRQEFISLDGNVDLSSIFRADLPSLNIPLLTLTNETETNFVEMGPIQAIDCVNALLTVRAILMDNGYDIDEAKTLAFGHSHGAYLALLANRFFPWLFSAIIDGSGWLLPEYLTKDRILLSQYNQHNLRMYTRYKIAESECDFQIRDIRNLYKTFDNNAIIITYQGIDDSLVDSIEKLRLFSQIPNTIFTLVTSELVDGKIFKSTGHGDFDFLLLFENVMMKYLHLIEERNYKPIKNEQIITTKKAIYRFFIQDQGPHIEILKNR